MLASPDAQQDDDLLARLRSGDEVAFNALVDRHRPWLVRLCTRLLGDDTHGAEDAAQESLLKLHHAARRDARPLRIRAWLTVVARNTCVDEKRRRRPDLPGVLPERALRSDDPFALDAALSDAWSRLAGRHREVLYLREVLGFSYKEIESVMGLSMAAVETLLFRARAALRREYERAGGTGFGCGLFGFHLARFGWKPRRDPSMTGGMPGVALNDPGFSGLVSRVTHFLVTSVPGCSEQVVAKVLSMAAGAAVVAATVFPGLGPLAERAPTGAPLGGAMTAAPVLSAGPAAAFNSGTMPAEPVTMRSLLGAAAPVGWSPQRLRTTEEPSKRLAPPPAVEPRRARRAPLHDAAGTAHEATGTARSGGPAALGPRAIDPGPLPTILPSRPDGVARPVHPAEGGAWRSVTNAVAPPPDPTCEPDFSELRSGASRPATGPSRFSPGACGPRRPAPLPTPGAAGPGSRGLAMCRGGTGTRRRTRFRC